MQGLKRVSTCLVILNLLPAAAPAQSIWQKIKQQAAEAEARAKAAQAAKTTAGGAAHTTTAASAAQRNTVKEGPLATPELMAQLASTMPRFSVADIKLGMSVRDSMLALKAHNSILTATPLPITFELIPNQQLLTGADANEPISSKATHEEVHVAFTMAPNAPVVDAVSRNVYYPAGKRPTLQQAVRAMTSAYGQPSIPPRFPGNNPEYQWVYNSAGKQLTDAQVADMPRNCADSTDAMARARDANHIVANGYQPKTDFDAARHGETCAPYTVLNVILRTQSSPTGEKLVVLLAVSAISDSLLRSASQVTHAQYLAAQQTKDQADKNTAQQNKATF